MIRYRLRRVIKVPFLPATECDFCWTDRTFFLLNEFFSFYFTFNTLRSLSYTDGVDCSGVDDVPPSAVYRKADNNYTGQHLRKMQRSAGSHDRCPMACLQMDGGGEKINNIIFSWKVYVCVCACVRYSGCESRDTCPGIVDGQRYGQIIIYRWEQHWYNNCTVHVVWRLRFLGPPGTNDIGNELGTD